MFQLGTQTHDLQENAGKVFQQSSESANCIQNMNVQIMMTLWALARIDKQECAARFSINDTKKLDLLEHLSHEEMASVAPATYFLNDINKALSILHETYSPKMNPATRLSFSIRLMMEKLPVPNS